MRAQDQAAADQHPLQPGGRAGKWPPQIKYIIGNEACERFSFYGMKAILALYITGVLHKTRDEATTIIHLFGFANYFMPLLGAWLSDRLWGRYHTILWVSLFYCAGHGVLALSDFVHTTDAKVMCLYVGLGLIAFGAGGIKPCVSAFMGDQFRPDQRHLLQKAYAAFYWSINLGSFFAFLIIPALRKHLGYSWAFGIPGIFMAIATLVFWLGTRHYRRIPPAGDPEWRTKVGWIFGIMGLFSALFYLRQKDPRIWLWAVTAVAVAFFIWIWWATLRLHRRVDSADGKVEAGAFAVWWYALTKRIGGRGEEFWQGASARFTNKSLDHGVSLGRILSIFALVPVFWALFDQTFSTWVLQGEQMVPFAVQLWYPDFGALLTQFELRAVPFTWTVGPEEMLSANPLLVMILIPIMTFGVYPVMGRMATPLRRMTLGMYVAAASYVVVAVLQSRIEAGDQLSVLWQAVPYVVLTIAEVLVSITGLEFAFTQAAPEMKSTIMSYWLLTVAVGNLLVSGITSVMSGAAAQGAVSTSRFLMYAGLTFVVAIAFTFVAERYRYREEPAAH